MSPSRRDSGGPRTPEERERDRLERERRRARQRGADTSEDGASRLAPAPLSYESPPPDDPEYSWSQLPPPAYPAADAAPPPDYADLPPALPAHHAEVRAPEEYPAEPAYPGEPGYPPDLEHPQAEPTGDPGDPAPWRATRPRPRRPPAVPGAEIGEPSAGVPAALARASAALAGAAAAASSASAAALSRARRQLARDRPPGGAEAGAGAEDRIEPDAGSLRAPVSPFTGRRPAASTASRPRPRPRVRPRTTTSRTTTSVSKPKHQLRDSAAPRSRRGRIAAVVALVGVVFALWFIFSLFQPFKGSGRGTVAVDVPRGASSSTIATLLADRGVISSGFFFKLRATLSGKRSQLESGHFTLRRDMSYGAALTALTGHQGQAPQISVTIPEGLSRTEIATVARRQGVTGDYVKASLHSHVLRPRAYGAGSAHSLEGFLFPATYDLLPGDPASKLVNAQLTAFKTNLARVDLAAARRKRLTTYDVLTIASMVEREAQLSSERGMIAAVIYNRLHLGIPLGIDATIRYAINDYLRPLTASDLRLASPYNTRVHKGLPPTPIGNPGLASIEAAAHPASVGYLYYVVKPGTCGQHAFSTTFSQFQQDVARYDSARTAKGGKSPTSCAH